jgi:hypothetical protein
MEIRDGGAWCAVASAHVEAAHGLISLLPRN